MNVSVVTTPLDKVAADWIVLGLSDNHAELSGNAAAVDKALGGVIARLAASGDLGRKAMEITPLVGLTGTAAPRVLVVGLGNSQPIDAGQWFRAAGAAARCIAAKKYERVAFDLPAVCCDAIGAESAAEVVAAAAAVGSQGQDIYRTEKKRFPFAELVIATSSEHRAAAERGARQGEILGRSVNLARTLVNEPPHILYPATFAERAADAAKRSGLECTVLDEQALERERMAGLLGVAAGSNRPPRMVVLQYRGAPTGELLALVGKGVTFDSGGLSLKTAQQMETMKCDMAGAATVLAAMQAIAELKLPINVIGFMGLVENLPSGTSLKVGDVITARSGKTIEVLNTDAEGRIVLADVLSYAVDQKPSHLIDLATLTGSCVVALGTDVAGLMSNNQPWADRVLDAAKAVGEPLWQLPMFSLYADLIRSDVADIKNIGGRSGGAITAAKFLENFVGVVPWVHLDIAGPAFAEKECAWRDGGGSGCFVRTLVELARGYNL